MALAISRSPDTTVPLIVTASCLHISADQQPWLRLVKRFYLPVLAQTLTAIRCGEADPCIFIHGEADSGKSLLATAMVAEHPAVWCLDCLANAYQSQTDIRLHDLELTGCRVFIIDELDFLNGRDLQQFYRRCKDQHIILILLDQYRDAPERIGFQLPPRTVVFCLSRDDGLILQTAFFDDEETAGC